MSHQRRRSHGSPSDFAAIATAAAELFAVAIVRRPRHISPMEGVNELAEVAALVGDPARANILVALLDGRALTASELAFSSRVTPQTASGHLSKLTNAKLLTLVKQGRHHYYRLAGPRVGRMLEGIMDVAAMRPPRFRPYSKLENKWRRARTCYDHLAGQLGVGIAEKMCTHGHLVLSDEGGDLTPKGDKLLSKLGVELGKARVGKRVFCRPCLDWTERRPHLGGAIGAAIAERCFDLGWVEHLRDSRGLKITAKGERGLLETFDLSV